MFSHFLIKNALQNGDAAPNYKAFMSVKYSVLLVRAASLTDTKIISLSF